MPSRCMAACRSWGGQIIVSCGGGEGGCGGGGGGVGGGGYSGE